MRRWKQPENGVLSPRRRSPPGCWILSTSQGENGGQGEEIRHVDQETTLSEFWIRPLDGRGDVHRERDRGTARARCQEGGAAVPRSGRRHECRPLPDDAKPPLSQ